MSLNALRLKSISSPCISIRRYKGNKPSKVSAFDYCLDLIKTNDNENFLCTLLLPNSVRSAAIAIRAFNVEIAKAASASKDVRIALMRLKFWHETVDRIYAKNPPNQPVAALLAKAVSNHNLKKRQLLRLVNAREKQLDKPCFSNIKEMEDYSEETVSPVLYMLLEAAGIKNMNADHAASHIGKAQGLTNLLRATGLEGGSWALPRDLLESSSLSVGRGLSPGSEVTKDIVFKIASQAKSHLDKARSIKPDLPKGSHIYLLPAVPTYKYLLRLRENDFDVFNPFLRERNFILGPSILWAKMTKSY